MTRLPPGERARYRAEMAKAVRRHFDRALAVYLAFAALFVGTERVYHPDHARELALLYLGQLVLCLLAAAARRLPGLRGRTAAVGVALTAALLATMAWYEAAVGHDPERLAIAMACVLTGMGVLVPWGAGPQLVVAVAALASFVAALPALPGGDPAAIALAGLVAVAAGSVVSALVLDRYRAEAFLETALHQEAAETAAALLDVGQTLHTHLERPDMLDRVAALAAETVGTDWCQIWSWDDRGRAFRLRGTAGVSAEDRAELGQLEFGDDSLPLLAALRPGHSLEIAQAAGQTLVPSDLLRRWHTTSAIFAPIARQDEVIGIVVCGHHARTGPFSSRARRLVVGIAQAIAIALDNARLIARLQTASQLKSEFVSTMSHELRTPLNVITGYSDLLLEGAFGPLDVAQRDTLLRMRRSTLELTDLVNATLDVNRLEAGRETVALGPVSIAEVYGELAHELEPLVTGEVALRWHDGLAGRALRSDRLKVKTILKNLVGNALKFTPSGTIDVAADVRDGTLVLRVRDTGIGIEPHALPAIFEMFRQADGSSTRRFGGVGLGLHIVKRLAEVLSGAVEVDSSPGRGTTFTVRLPVAWATDEREAG